MTGEVDVNIFVTRDNSRDYHEGQYFAEVYQLDSEGNPIGEPLLNTECYISAARAIRAAEEAWRTFE